MSTETKEALREELAQARWRMFDEAADPAARELIRADIAELERRLLTEMGAGPES